EDAIAPLWKGQRFPLEACVSGWAMTNRKPAVIPDIYADARVPAEAYRPTFVKSMVMVPIREVAPIGAIGSYWARPQRADQIDVKLLSALANSTSIAMENVQLYQHLERRVEERTAELVRLQRQKEELAALIVHDLRSPANGLMLASQARLKSKNTTDTDRQHWQRVHTSAEAINRMAMNLLDVMRSEDGTFAPRLQEVPVDRLLGDVIDRMTPLASSLAVRLSLDMAAGLPTLRADRELVGRVLQNLIDNALRYAPEDSTVQVAARAAGDGLELRVSDHGPGIPPEKRDEVFTKWVRLAGAAERASEGRGLGLAFSRLAVESHGGTISIEPNRPRGAVFVVRLPLAAAT
ncbi:MAG TPA: ATP-binding protein, partial [Kofleriaceae bacterium]|nr:ATP-binding protein [Kofleriaceae bacterium]